MKKMPSVGCRMDFAYEVDGDAFKRMRRKIWILNKSKIKRTIFRHLLNDVAWTKLAANITGNPWPKNWDWIRAVLARPKCPAKKESCIVFKTSSLNLTGTTNCSKDLIGKAKNLNSVNWVIFQIELQFFVLCFVEISFFGIKKTLL